MHRRIELRNPEAAARCADGLPDDPAAYLPTGGVFRTGTGRWSRSRAAKPRRRAVEEWKQAATRGVLPAARQSVAPPSRDQDSRPSRAAGRGAPTFDAGPFLEGVQRLRPRQPRRARVRDHHDGALLASRSVCGIRYQGLGSAHRSPGWCQPAHAGAGSHACRSPAGGADVLRRGGRWLKVSPIEGRALRESDIGDGTGGDP